MFITTYVDQEKQLTIFTIIGAPSFEEAMEKIKAFHEHPTKNTLWDLRSARLMPADSSYENLQSMVKYAGSYGDIRKDGKSAVVAPKDLEFGVGNMVQTLGELEGLPYTIKVFRSMDEADQWLGE